MNLLGAKLYDPAAAVTKATSALLAMTVLDNVNLRTEMLAALKAINAGVRADRIAVMDEGGEYTRSRIA